MRTTGRFPAPLLAIALALSAAAVGCGGGSAWVPLSAERSPEADLTLVWVGRGEAERLEGGTWKRVPEFDYEFTVEQRRYAGRWVSVKHMRRLHPAYDGSAGPRSQGLFFDLTYGPGEGAQLRSRVVSSLGRGAGTTDAEFRAATLEIRADVSSMAPFDRYRIVQSYRYEEGQLEETVSLDKGDRPWVRNKETATLFAKRAFEGAPTRATTAARD